MSNEKQNNQQGHLCVICGRGPHPIDDPLCCPPTAGPAGQVAVLQHRAEEAERALAEANTNWAALVRAQQERADAAERALRKWEIPTVSNMTQSNTLPPCAKSGATE